MRIHFNLAKALSIVRAVEKVMAAEGLHVHGLSGAELEALTTKALSVGHTIKTAVTDLALDAKAAADSPEAPA